MANKFFSRVAGICLLFISQSAHSQMVDCNVFLKGRYVEVGIQPKGCYGSTTDAPAGYHPHLTTPVNLQDSGCAASSTSTSYSSIYSLGFVADADMDGWNVGTPPYYGDYFLPGSPFEGWRIDMDSISGQAFNTDLGFLGGLTGANIDYTVSGSVLSTTWLGNFHGLQIRKVTSLDTNALYFTTTVTFTNLDTIAHNDIFYIRTFDPDNDVTDTFGSYNTINNIEYQLPDSLNATVVSASGITYSAAYVAMGSIDSNAKCFIYNVWPLVSSASLQSFYFGTSGYTAFYSGSNSGDLAIALEFNVGHLAPVDSAVDSVGRIAGKHPANSKTISYFTAFSHHAVDSAIKHLTAPSSVVSSISNISHVESRAAITVYPNPSSEMVNVAGLISSDKVTGYDMMGRAVFQYTPLSGSGLNRLDLKALTSGSYLLVVSDANGNVVSRIPFRKQ